jgi:hypothetical protein
MVYSQRNRRRLKPPTAANPPIVVSVEPVAEPTTDAGAPQSSNDRGEQR